MVRQTKTRTHIDKSLGTSSSSARSILFHGGRVVPSKAPLWIAGVQQFCQVTRSMQGIGNVLFFDLVSFVNMGNIKYYFGDVLTPCGPLFVSCTGDEG